MVSEAMMCQWKLIHVETGMKLYITLQAVTDLLQYFTNTLTVLSEISAQKLSFKLHKL